MTLLEPIALLGLLSLPILVIFYLFRPDPRQAQSTTYFLWREAQPDSQGGAFANRLQHNPLLWLQLLILLLLTLFLCRLAKPWSSQNPTSDRVILIIDRSASMSASNSFEKAKAEAGLAVDSMLGFRFAGSSPEVMLLAVDHEAQVLVPFTKDQALLRETIRRLQVTDLPDNLDRLGPFVKSLIKAHNAKIWLFGDRLPEALKTEGLQFSTVAEGENNNAAISSFSVRYPDPERGETKPFLYARVDNFSPTAQQRVLRLEKMRPDKPDVVEALILERSVSLASQSGQTVLESIAASRFEPNKAALFRLSLAPIPGSAEDIFSTDDLAFCLLPPFAKQRVTVALGPEVKATFLLRAIAASSELRVAKVEELLSSADPPVVDLLISTSQFKPPSKLQVQSRFLLAPPPGDKKYPVSTLKLSGPNPPLVGDSGVEWNRLSVSLTETAALKEGEISLLECAEGPALTLSGVKNGLPTLDWKFPLSYSSLPLSTGMPVIVGRFIDTYARSSDLSFQGSVSSGSLLKRPTGYQWKGALTLSPLSESTRLSAARTVPADSEEIAPPVYNGLYYLHKQNSKLNQGLAVNLFNQQESSLNRSFEDANFELKAESGAAQNLSGERTQYREIGVPFLFLSLFLLLFEAWLFLRRGRP